MWDRYDPRDNDRDRDDGCERAIVGRGGGTGDRNPCDEPHPRDVYTKDLDLPRGRERRPVRERDHVYEIDGTESRLLATVGTFRVVSESDLRDGGEDTRRAQRHLERAGLLQTVPLSSDDRAVVLTDRGRDLLEANRHEGHERSWEPRQTFHAGLRKPRELTHDSKVYRAYLHAEERLREQGGRVDRVVLDYELKRDYQRFLHERNRGRNDCDGRPDREPEEIARWARERAVETLRNIAAITDRSRAPRAQPPGVGGRSQTLISASDPGRAEFKSARPGANPSTPQINGTRPRACRSGGCDMKPWLNVSEAAEYAGVSRDTIYTACERHELRSARVSGRRAIRIRPHWIDNWLEQHSTDANGQQSAEMSPRGGLS